MSEQKQTEGGLLARFASPIIILATIIWGSSFVVMKSSVDVLPTFWLLAIRFSFAALVLSLVFWKRWKVLDRQYLIGGAIMGFCLFVAYAFQTFGLARTTPGKNAFLTAVYCVIVPFLYWVIAKRRPDRFNVLAALLCIVGIGLVSVTGEDAAAFNLGDILTLIGGFFFAAHIVAVDKYAEGRDIFILTALQFASFAVFSWLGVLVTRPPLAEGPLWRALLHPLGRRKAHCPDVPGLCADFHCSSMLRNQVLLPAEEAGSCPQKVGRPPKGRPRDRMGVAANPSKKTVDKSKGPAYNTEQQVNHTNL